MQIKDIIGLSVIVGGFGCTDVPAGIPIDEDNTEGVASIETTRFETNGDQVFELRGLNAVGDAVAFVRKRIGVIDDLMGPTHFGSEIILGADGKQSRIISGEVELNHLLPVGDSTIDGFLEVTAVSEALREANIVVIAPPRTPGTGEAPYTAASCTTSDLVATVAPQCCEMNAPQTYTIHVLPTGLISRYKNPSGTGCKASDGVTTCAGRQCYFGPNGFAIASVDDEDSSWWVSTLLVNNNLQCVGIGNSHHGATFPSVTGTYPVGAGCCGDKSGPCLSGACAACSPPGSDSGEGVWDY